MNCLDNFIGIRQLCASDAIQPRSGLFIEDLEGMSLHNIASITTEWPNAAKLVNQKIQFAGKKVLDEIFQTIAPDLVDALIVERGQGGEFSDKNDSDPTDYHAPMIGNNGLLVRKARTVYTSLRIPNLYLLCNDDLPSVILTLTDGTETKNLVVNDITAGVEKQVFCDYVAKTEQVIITWDTTAISTSKGSTYRTTKTNHCGCASGTYEFIVATGIKAGSQTNELYGIRADIQVECDTQKMMCLLTNRLSMCILYQTGIELLNEWEASDRMTFLAIHGKEWAEAKKLEWKDEVNSRLETMKPMLKNYLMNFDSFCFKCGGYRYGYVHP